MRLTSNSYLAYLNAMTGPGSMLYSHVDSVKLCTGRIITSIPYCFDLEWASITQSTVNILDLNAYQYRCASATSENDENS